MMRWLGLLLLPTYPQADTQTGAAIHPDYFIVLMKDGQFRPEFEGHILEGSLEGFLRDKFEEGWQVGFECARMPSQEELHEADSSDETIVGQDWYIRHYVPQIVEEGGADA